MRFAPARRYTGPRHHADWRPAALRRWRPAGLTSRAAAACTLGAVALAGLIVITVSVLTVATGQAGGPLAQTLEASSGELALLALTVSVVLGVAATERHFLPPGARVTAQIAHRAVALTAFGFLVVHILLETVGGNATPLAAVLPFVSASERLYLGLGTMASDLVIAVIATSVARMRYSRSAHPHLWRVVHLCVYVAWPMAILHGILMPGVPVWAAWTYGICAAAVALASTARIRMRGPLPQVPGGALRELLPALPPGVAGLGTARRAAARPGSRRPVAAAPQALNPPGYGPPGYGPPARHQAGPAGRPAPGGQPGHPHRPAYRGQPGHPSRPASREQPVHRGQPGHPSRPASREQPVDRAQPGHRARPASREQPVDRGQPAHRARPAHRPRIVARRPAHYRPEHPEPPEYPGPRPVPGPAPPWPPARHPTDPY
jgi:DMSO/TMAO reductase YedYZ heme-binding membrane subunit